MLGGHKPKLCTYCVTGKSEFLRTLTLGLVANHSPATLNLILVDFKGGATFLGFDRLPHVSAVITNLADEAPLVARMRDALAGELNRRQEVLRAAGCAGVADYDRARSAGRALPPLPALFIVVDEFSEMLTQHPEFAELFVAIGRLGRSLRIHLLLASQRLDEGRLRGLESHLSYRICLKTFSANESRTVLGVPDAHTLPGNPGAAYLRTPSGELTRFQAAYVSGTYAAPAARATTTAPARPRVTRFCAAPVGSVSMAAASPSAASPSAAAPDAGNRTVLDAVVGCLTGHGPDAHRVWLPPLAESPPLDRLLEHAGPLAVPVGVIDRPYDQRRDPLLVELGGAAGNVAVVGAPQAGKSTTLRTLVLALASCHRPADVQCYCLDFGGGSLAALAGLPHVGAVAGRGQPDLVRRTVADMTMLLRAREDRFRELGIDSMAEFRRRCAAGDPAVAGERSGDAFLVVDGWSAIRQEHESLEATITDLAARGLSYGIHVVIAASRWAELRAAVKDQLGTRIELRLADSADSELDRKAAALVPADRPGRGITPAGEQLQVALPRLDGRADAADLAAALGEAADGLRARHGDEAAPPVRLLPEVVEFAAPAGEGSAVRLALGLAEGDLAPVWLDFTEQSHLLILGDNGCGKTAVLRTVCRSLCHDASGAARVLVVDYRRTLLGVVETDHLFGYAMSATALESHVTALTSELRSRLPGADVTQAQLRDRSWWSGPEIYVVVDDYDLVATAGGNPLLPLLEFVPQARDVGLHLVVARRTGGAARAMFDPLLGRLREVGCAGLMMSGGADEGVLIGGVRPAVLPPGRGTLVTRRGGEQVLQVAWSPE